MNDMGVFIVTIKVILPSPSHTDAFNATGMVEYAKKRSPQNSTWISIDNEIVKFNNIEVSSILFYFA
jgi:hypothetical protein